MKKTNRKIIDVDAEAKRLGLPPAKKQAANGKVHLIYTFSVRNGMTRYQYIIAPPSHADEGRHVGSYPDVATAYHAAIKKGALGVYLHCPDDFPFVMRNASDTRGMAWCKGKA